MEYNQGYSDFAYVDAAMVATHRNTALCQLDDMPNNRYWQGALDGLTAAAQRAEMVAFFGLSADSVATMEPEPKGV